MAFIPSAIWLIPTPPYSTVTLLARFLGISTSLPSRMAISIESSCTTTNIEKNSSMGWSYPGVRMRSSARAIGACFISPAR